MLKADTGFLPQLLIFMSLYNQNPKLHFFSNKCLNLSKYNPYKNERDLKQSIADRAFGR